MKNRLWIFCKVSVTILVRPHQIQYSTFERKSKKSTKETNARLCCGGDQIIARTSGRVNRINNQSGSSGRTGASILLNWMNLIKHDHELRQSANRFSQVKHAWMLSLFSSKGSSKALRAITAGYCALVVALALHWHMYMVVECTNYLTELDTHDTCDVMMSMPVNRAEMPW